MTYIAPNSIFTEESWHIVKELLWGKIGWCDQLHLVVPVLS